MPQKRTSSPRKRLFIWSAVIMLSVAVIAASIYAVKRNNNGVPVNSTTANSETKGETATTPEQTGEPTDTNGKTDTATAPESTVAPHAPTGNFISSHKLSLSGQGTANLESTCTTIPGAYCQIDFVNGSNVKTLQSKVTDSGGAVYWSWNLKSIGITAGTWQIRATAKNGSQTAVTTDALPLEVSE